MNSSAPTIDFVIMLERNLTEGSYHKALRARKDSPSKLFEWLLQELEDTVRDEVASCIEVSHRSLKLERACNLLQLDSVQATQQFCTTREDWIVQGDLIMFPARSQVKHLNKDSIPADWTVHECLNMAVELDRIV